VSSVAELEIDGVVDEVLGRYSPDPSSLISVLEDLQEEMHYLPREALDQVSTALGVPRSQSYHVATFYRAFSLKPRGQHTISICRGTACHVKGADKIADILKMELNVSEDETTEDGMFTVQSVRCLGCCSLAPAIMIDRHVFGEVTSLSLLREILRSYREDRTRDTDAPTQD